MAIVITVQSEELILRGSFNTTVGITEEIFCSSKNGNPPAQFQWSIDDGRNEIDITDNSTSGDGESMLGYTAQRSHNGSEIVCEVTQQGISNDRYVREPLFVMCELQYHKFYTKCVVMFVTK